MTLKLVKFDMAQALKDAEKRYVNENNQYDWFDASVRSFRPRLKAYKKLNLFKGSNVVFDPARIEATSYRWWYFVKVIKGKVVFNNYSYSPSTSKHQYKVRGLMEQLGIEIDVTIESPNGLQDLDSSIRSYEYKIKKLKELINNPKSRNGANMRRLEEIGEYQQKIEAVKELMAGQGQESEAA